MKFWLLKNVANFFGNQEVIYCIKRIDDNLLKLDLDNKIFYIDMTKSNSRIFVTSEFFLPSKMYQAPFDVMLHRFCSRAKIIGCEVDGNNRIFRFLCERSGAYKNTRFFLQFEFTGRHTNVILLDMDFLVIEALRHINFEKSFREVKIGKKLFPLPQPKNFAEEDKEILSDTALFEFLEAEYSAALEKKLVAKKQIICANLSNKIQKLQIVLATLPEEKELLEEAKKISTNANIILANLNKIKNFATEICIEDFGGTQVLISLPSGSRTPQEAANMMFDKAKKLVRKAKNTFLQIQSLEDKIAFLQAEIMYIQSIVSLQDLSILEPKKSSKKSLSKYETFFIEGVKISIGRNRSENQSLLEEAKADDIWLHIRDVPSAHMIIHCGKGKISQELLMKAGEILVGLHSIQKGDFDVDYTRRRFVKIIQGSNVVYSKHQSFHYRK